MGEEPNNVTRDQQRKAVGPDASDQIIDRSPPRRVGFGAAGLTINAARKVAAVRNTERPNGCKTQPFWRLVLLKPQSQPAAGLYGG